MATILREQSVSFDALSGALTELQSPVLCGRSTYSVMNVSLTRTGRIAGQGGKVKFTIENASKTRIVLADTSVLCCRWPVYKR